MECKGTNLALQWGIFALLLNFYLTDGSPPGYNLFQGSAYSGPAHRHRNRNWCAYIVHKNVSCAVQGNVESFVEPEVAPCPVHEPDCEPQVMHRTRFRPTYKLAYKTVTELEWRCCPGHHGPDCKDVKASPNRRTVDGAQFYPGPNPGQPRHTQRAERRETGQHEARYGGGEPDKVRLLEGEVQRLSRTVLDLQAAVAGLTAGLQEDAGKMLVTLLNNMRPPDADGGAGAGGAEEGGAGAAAVHLDGHQATRGGPAGDRGLEKVMARLDDMNDALKSRDEALEELRGTVTGQEGQIRLLMDASQSQAPPPAAGGGDGGGPAPADLDVLQAYIDNKLEKLRRELDQGVDERMTKLQSACDDKVRSAQKVCEEVREKGLVSLTELVDSREADLRKEIRELRLDMTLSDGPVRTQRQTDPAVPAPATSERDDLKDLWRELGRVADAHRALNARMDNELAHLSEPRFDDDEYGPLLEELEARVNVTERNAEVHCFYVEEKLSKALADEAAELRRLMDERLGGMEDQFTGMLVEMSNSTFPGTFGDSLDAVQAEVNNNKFLLRGLDDKVNAVGEMCSSGCPAPGPSSSSYPADVAKDVWLVKNDVEVIRADVAAVSDKLRELGDAVDRQVPAHLGGATAAAVEDLQRGFVGLRDSVGGLAGTVAGLAGAVGQHSRDVQRLDSSCCSPAVGQRRRPEAPEGTAPNDGRLEELGDRLDALGAELAGSREAASEGVAAVSGRVSRLEKVCGRMEAVSDNVRGVREVLERHVAGLWECVRGMNRTLGAHAGDIGMLRGSLRNFQTQLSGMAKHLRNDVAAKESGTGVRPQRPASAPDSGRTAPVQVQIHPRPRVHQVPQIHIPLVIPALRPLPATPRQPTLTLVPVVPDSPSRQRPVEETGEAGPPGFMRRVTVRRAQGSEDAATPVKGFAGAPGYPPVRPVSFKPENMPAVSRIPWNPSFQSPVVSTVLSESSAADDLFSFSAGLTQLPVVSGEFGAVRFNRVLVNDGGHYSPHTGIFSVPADGRYLVSGLLTARRGDRVEAVLSVSDRSVQRLRSSSGRHDDGDGACACGGSVSFSLILPLRRGDGVALVRTAGQLATTEAREILSTFSAIFLYAPPPASR